MIIMVSAKKSRLKRISCIIAIAVFAFSALSMLVTKLVYDGVFQRYDARVQVPEELAELAQQRQLVRYPSGENQLTGYYYPGPEQPHGLVVLVPGFHAGADSYLWQIRSLLDYGWAVFSFDATGTCASQGEDQVGFSQIVLDLEATLKYVENNLNFGYNEIALLGHSRGGYAACCVLGRETEVAAVASVSGINSAMEGVMQSAEQTVGPVAYGNYGFVWLYQTMLFGQELLELEASQAIAQGRTPVLVIHGAQDTQVPLDSGSVMAYREQIGEENVDYLVCQAGHTDLLYDADGTANDGLMLRIHRFFLDSIKR